MCRHTSERSAPYSLEGFDPDHDGFALNHWQRADLLERLGYGPIRCVMQHENEGNTGAFMALGLDHRRDPDVRVSKDFGDLRQRAGHVDDAKPNEIARDNLIDR